MSANPLCSNPFCLNGFGVDIGCLKFPSHRVFGALLLMAEILHHLGCKNPTNNGRSYLSTGAGFLPSTVGNGCFDQFDLLMSFLCDHFSPSKHPGVDMILNLLDTTSPKTS